MLFKDIVQFTKPGLWQCDYDVDYFARWIIKQMCESKLQLCPWFHRGRVWTKDQQIAYLEYFFRGGQSGFVISLNAPDWLHTVTNNVYNDYVCVDGVQRCIAIHRFVNNEIPIFNTYYRDFEDKPEQKITININDLTTETEVLQWYVDINDSYTTHNKEEIAQVKRKISHMREQK